MVLGIFAVFWVRYTIICSRETVRRPAYGWFELLGQ